ncbi:MAG: hypothetical protein Q7T05_03870 [Dehalococcoidia bacterium]|nr:hypothetical protein [Dehalococcoidia bacterium]
MNEQTQPQSPIADMDQRQMELYARDLEQLYWSERQVRLALAEEKLVLEFKVNELNALNRLFQSNLVEERRLRESYQGLIRRLKELAGREDGNGVIRDLRVLILDAEAIMPILEHRQA